MQVKNRLTAVWIRIHDHPITLPLDPRISREIAREREQSAEQIRVFGVVQRADVCGRDDEQMRRRLRIRSRKASMLSSRLTIVAGISPDAILQNTQVVILGRPPRPAPSGSYPRSARLPPSAAARLRRHAASRAASFARA